MQQGQDQAEAAVRALSSRVSCRRRRRLALPRPRRHWEELDPNGTARTPPTRRLSNLFLNSSFLNNSFRGKTPEIPEDQKPSRKLSLHLAVRKLFARRRVILVWTG
ncbi:hypothetical protein ZWY2020_041253 [Hordeum vulgare]|nr:hypothetical protein ZWY2020_041253 [Hordeum vulgare]